MGYRPRVQPVDRGQPSDGVDMAEGACGECGCGCAGVAPTDCQCGNLTTAHNLQSQIRSKSHGVAHSEDKCDGQTTSLRTKVGWGRGHRDWDWDWNSELWTVDCGLRTTDSSDVTGSRIQTDADTDARTRTQSRCVFGLVLVCFWAKEYATPSRARRVSGPDESYSRQWSTVEARCCTVRNHGLMCKGGEGNFQETLIKQARIYLL